MITNHKTVVAFLLLVLSLTFAEYAKAQTPVVGYQGAISLPDGSALNSPDYQITTTIYSDEAGTQPIWTDTYHTAVTNGVFSLALGSNTPLPNAKALDKPLWLGVAVSGGNEMRPLTRLTAVPMAYNVADNAITTDKLTEGAVTSSKLAPQSVTADKLGVDFISAISINGHRETLKDRTLNIRSAGETPVYFNEETSTLTIGNAERAPGNFIGNQPAPFPNTDDGTFGASNPASTNAVVGGESNEAWDMVGTVNTPPDLLGYDFVGGGYGNKSWGRFDAIAGGDTNTIYGDTSFIGGGQLNRINSNFAAIGGGESNLIDGKYSAITGGLLNNAGGDLGAIGGGFFNILAVSSSLGFIGGGDSNKVQVKYGVIGGGHRNFVDGGTAVGGAILGGAYNNAFGTFGSIAGGDSNTISNKSPLSFIGAGHLNSAIAWGHSGVVAGDSNTAYGFGSVVGAGFKNKALGNRTAIVAGKYHQIDSSVSNSSIDAGLNDTITWLGTNSAIGAGQRNVIRQGSSFIGAGTDNLMNGDRAAIVAGVYNTITGTGDGGFIGGGAADTVRATASAIVAGEYNTINGDAALSVIGAGYVNTIDSGSWNSGIGSGSYNRIRGIDATSSVGSVQSFIGAGTRNFLWGVNGFIGAGDTNQIIVDGRTAFDDAIGGGFLNTITGSDSGFIGGGAHNLIQKSDACVIGGGNFNMILALTATGAPYSTISGGRGNVLKSEYATIAGGDSNTIGLHSEFAFIGGGDSNTVQASMPFATIGGGHHNVIGSFGAAATIPGGDSLEASSYAQVVLGYNNVPVGTFTKGTPHDFAGSMGVADEPLIIVGNGDDGVLLRSNAFEISYDGHTTVFDQNGNTSSGLMRPPVYGASYNDNIIVAWGDVDPGAMVGAAPSINGDFGVTTITNPSNGVFVVTLLSALPDGGGAKIFPVGSVTATLKELDMDPEDGTVGCGSITSTPIGVVSGSPNRIIIRTYDGSCALTNRSFFFKVVAQ